MVAIIATLAAVPVACTAGTAVYTRGQQQYARETQTRHAVTATVTNATGGNFGTVIVHARWSTPRGERTAALQWNEPVKAGQRTELWVDNDFRQLDPPTPMSRAVIDGVATGGMVQLILGVTVGLLAAALRCGLGRWRETQWELELRSLIDDNGGPSSRQR